jgi:hypothetical protein
MKSRPVQTDIDVLSCTIAGTHPSAAAAVDRQGDRREAQTARLGEVLRPASERGHPLHAGSSSRQRRQRSLVGPTLPLCCGWRQPAIWGAMLGFVLS